MYYWTVDRSYDIQIPGAIHQHIPPSKLNINDQRLQKEAASGKGFSRPKIQFNYIGTNTNECKKFLNSQLRTSPNCPTASCH